MSRKNGKRGILSHIFWLLVLAGFIASLVVLAPYAMDALGIRQEDKKIMYEVSPDDTLATVSQDLRSEGIVLSARAYRTFSNRISPNMEFYAGVYELNTNMSYEKIIKTLEGEPVIDKSVVKVVFPEGTTVAEMAEILEENNICTAKDFIKAQNEHEFDYDFVKAIDTSEKRAYRLEGYLFPATYDFQKNSEAHNIVSRMLQCFDEKITPDIKTRIAEMETTLDDIISLASVIQDEAFNQESIKNVSSVFWNRINSTYLKKLQSNPTRDYADKLIKDSILIEEDARKYDTYSVEGIPVGPVTNPGLDMIIGALYPNDTNYYYFVTDANNNFYYAETYDGHVANCITAGVPYQ